MKTWSCVPRTEARERPILSREPSPFSPFPSAAAGKGTRVLQQVSFTVLHSVHIETWCMLGLSRLANEGLFAKCSRYMSAGLTLLGFLCKITRVHGRNWLSSVKFDIKLD
jgi:hypothetical protein